MLPRFEIVDRQRPVDVVAPGLVRFDRSFAPEAAPSELSAPARLVAPSAAVVAHLGHAEIAGRLVFGFQDQTGRRLQGWYDGGRRLLGIEVTDDAGRTRRHRSRRYGRPAGPVTAVAAVLTGSWLTVLAHDGRIGGRGWRARAKVDLRTTLPTRDEGFLAGLEGGYAWTPRAADPSPVTRLRVGPFGGLGLRDLHLATYADGAPYLLNGRVVLTASHAGPGGFDTGHTGVWLFDPRDHAFEHVADLHFRRPDRPGVYGDHATHLVRDCDQWLVATSTWGDFDRTRVRLTVTKTSADLLQGEHVLSMRELRVPTDGVGAWDPHLVRIDGEWHLAYVSATEFFRFHPVLARGPLDRLALVGEDRSRVATEGTTMTRIDGQWRVLASDGRDNPAGLRERYPVYDLALREVGALDAPYPSNIPWPTLLPMDDHWLMLTFDGTPAAGRLTGYGTHGDVLVMSTQPSLRSPGRSATDALPAGRGGSAP